MLLLDAACCYLYIMAASKLANARRSGTLKPLVAVDSLINLFLASRESIVLLLKILIPVMLWLSYQESLFILLLTLPKYEAQLSLS